MYGWMSCCKPLICNDRLLLQLEKIFCKINGGSVSLNQRVLGLSPSAPTKPFKDLHESTG
jgi:hypothetical protein